MNAARLGRVAAVAALVVGAALSASALSGAASATTSAIHCGKLTGNVASTVTLSLCNGNTGGASKAMTVSTVAQNGVITWANGKTTTVHLRPPTTTETDPTETKSCAAGTTEYELHGTVVADTTGSATVGHGFHAEVCVDASNNVTLEPGEPAHFA
jgi:hypothetical protein